MCDIPTRLPRWLALLFVEISLNGKKMKLPEIALLNRSQI
jgi:hypothetical protein